MKTFDLRFVKFDEVKTEEELKKAMNREGAQVGIAFMDKDKDTLLVLTAEATVATYCTRIPGCFNRGTNAVGGMIRLEVPVEDPRTQELLKDIAA